MEEREIDLIDLIADVLSHWRGILIAMVLGGIVLGGYSYVKSVQSVQNAQNAVEVSLEKKIAQLENSLTETERASVAAVINNEAEYALRQNYRENSIIMQMDPLNIPRIELFYKIQAKDVNQSYTLSAIYDNLVNGVDLAQWVEEQTEISAVNSKELVSTEETLISKEKESSIAALSQTHSTSPSIDSFRIIVYHADAAECEVLAEAVKSYIANQQKELTKNFGAHEVVLFSEYSGVVMDTGVMEEQLTNNDSMITLQTNIGKVKSVFTANQKTYYNLLIKQQNEMGEAVKSEVVGEKPVVQPTSSISVKYIFLGTVLFAIVYVAVILVMYILNGKLRATDDLQDLYNISQLGLVVKDFKKQFFVDKWIRVLRNRGKRLFTADQSLDLAITAVKISMAKNELNNICLVGCNMKAGADEVCKNLKTALEKENLSVTILDNVLYDAEAMERLEAVKGIVLAEKAGSTMYREIMDELELAERQGIKVLGGIVVE